MGMSRSQMMSVLGNVDDGKLAQALGAIGVEHGNEDYDLGEEGTADGLEGWNQRDVAIPAVKHEPLIDVKKFTKMADMEGKRRPEYMDGQEDDGSDDVMAYMPQPEAGKGQY